MKEYLESDHSQENLDIIKTLRKDLIHFHTGYKTPKMESNASGINKLTNFT